MNKKKIVSAIIIIFTVVTTSTIIAFAIQSSIDYATLLVLNEQNEHYYKMRNNITDLRGVTSNFERYIDILQKRQFTKDEALEVRKELRHLEEIAMNISHRTGLYHEDITAHIFFSPSGEITQYFESTKNTPLYINRFVRSVEVGLSGSYINWVQKDNILKNLKLLKSEIANL